eukprot:TRINITY_DN17709_c0_g1_i1.p1 TRINITY_DN17709_c0_g1~~TRINITY_DN17709_c0_g1_i1.p1  ORF type:complete len:296 (+),score=49.40 TRINITY_DN17709_c0_g1_i1:25-912(+)
MADPLADFYAELAKEEAKAPPLPPKQEPKPQVATVALPDFSSDLKKVVQQVQQEPKRKIQRVAPPPHSSSSSSSYSPSTNVPMPPQPPPLPPTTTTTLGRISAPPVVAPPTVTPSVSAPPQIKVQSSISQTPMITTGIPVSRPQARSALHGKKHYRAAAGKVWEDPSLQEWAEGDFRLFVGNLGNEVNTDQLIKAFSKYLSFLKAKVIRDKRSNKTKGYGFVSFADSQDMMKALKEMEGKYIGNRPIVLKVGDSKTREIGTKEAEKQLKAQKAAGWESKRKRKYHIHFEPYRVQT